MAANIPSFSLNNGLSIPSIGVGTWMGGYDDSVKEEAYLTTLNALKNGYRYIDTASGYNTESAVAKGIRDSGVPRKEIFLQTKLVMTEHERVKEAFEQSLRSLETDYIDSYLMHWPIAWNKDYTTSDYPFTKTWAQMETLLEDGKCKSIGVSNFSIKNLEVLLKEAKVVPAINQVELHPYLPSLELKEYCESKGIHLQAYTPLGKGIVGEEKVIQDLAKKYNVTTNQILLAWGVGRGTSVLAKSSNPERSKLNITLPNLSKEDIEAITNIHREAESKHRSVFFPGADKDKLLGVMTVEQLGWDPKLYKAYE